MVRAKGFRGTPFDVFGRTEERRGGRAAIGEFEAMMRGVVQQLTAGRLETALALARLPQGVRGYGHVKAQAADGARIRQQRLLAELASPAGKATATAAAGLVTAAAA